MGERRLHVFSLIAAKMSTRFECFDGTKRLRRGHMGTYGRIRAHQGGKLEGLEGGDARAAWASEEETEKTETTGKGGGVGTGPSLTRSLLEFFFTSDGADWDLPSRQHTAASHKE
jgi:hypothetical protein